MLPPWKLSFVTMLLWTTFGFNVVVHAHEGQELEEVVVQADRWPELTGALTSASEGIVGQAEIAARPRLRTGEILEVVPGLIVTQHSGSGKSNQLFLRGFNLDHGTDFATWIDGMPVNMPSHGHGQGYTDLNFMIPELIRSVQFRKGPYYAEVSDFSSAGAAFLTTANKLEDGQVVMGLGENGFARALVMDSMEVAQGDLLFGLQTHLYDGPWVGVDEDLHRYNGVVRFSRSDERREWNLTFMGYDASWDAADQVPLRAVNSGVVPALGTIDDTGGGTSSRYSLSGAWHQDIQGAKLLARGYWINYELDLFSNFTYFLDDPINGDQFEQVDQRNVFGGDISWQFAPAGRHQQTVALMLRHDAIDEVGLFNTSRRARVGTVRQDKVNQTSVGIFYDVDTQWNSRWRTSLGLRADYYNFDVRRSTLSSNQGSDSDFLVTPKIKVIYSPHDLVELFFSAGRAFHSNDARGVTVVIDPVNGEPADQVDPLVVSDGAEIGFRLFRDKKLNLSASFWYLELESELLFVGDAGNTEPSPASRRYGLEVPIYYQLNDIWTLDFEMSLSRGRFRGGDEIPGTLDRVLSAGITAQKQRGWYGSMRLRYFGERPLLEDDSVRSNPSTVVNLSVGYRMAQIDLRLDLLNVLDERDDDITYFYESRLQGEPVDGVADVHFHPMEPRQVRVYATWSF